MKLRSQPACVLACALAGLLSVSLQVSPGATAMTAGGPDFSGVWRTTAARPLTNLAVAGGISPFQPWGAKLFAERQRAAPKDRPSGRCLPRGLPGALLVRDRPWKIVQTPTLVAMLFDESLHFRQIHLDGRAFPSAMAPTWLGYSIGRWSGDALVVETIGFNEETWLDDSGHPHSDALRLTERYRRPSANRLELELMIDDAKAYLRPWRVALKFERLSESALEEHVCALY